MTIQHWPISERPREKLLQQGVESLSVAELLAILLRTGIKGKTALDLARDLLQHFGSLRKVLLAGAEEFRSVPGLGAAKFTQLQVVLELSKRCLYEEIQTSQALENVIAVKKYLFAKLGHRNREIFACLFLNAQLKVISYQELFFGGVNEAEVYPGEIVKTALTQHAASVIIAHNHPSGSLVPSQPDLQITKQIKQALELVQIKLLDHIIVSPMGTYSLAEHGKI